MTRRSAFGCMGGFVASKTAGEPHRNTLRGLPAELTIEPYVLGGYPRGIPHDYVPVAFWVAWVHYPRFHERVRKLMKTRPKWVHDNIRDSFSWVHPQVLRDAVREGDFKERA